MATKLAYLYDANFSNMSLWRATLRWATAKMKQMTWWLTNWRRRLQQVNKMKQSYSLTIRRSGDPTIRPRSDNLDPTIRPRSDDLTSIWGLDPTISIRRSRSDDLDPTISIRRSGDPTIRRSDDPTISIRRSDDLDPLIWLSLRRSDDPILTSTEGRRSASLLFLLAAIFLVSPPLVSRQFLSSDVAATFCLPLAATFSKVFSKALWCLQFLRFLLPAAPWLVFMTK
jgi:hypothetical protein